MTLRQLIQPYVQNSTATTRPRRPASVSGALLIQGPPARSGAGAPVRGGWASPGGASRSARGTSRARSHRDPRPSLALMPPIVSPAARPLVTTVSNVAAPRAHDQVLGSAGALPDEQVDRRERALLVADVLDHVDANLLERVAEVGGLAWRPGGG